ncbi:HipA N-terminal domain-containing protein [Hymenobacter cyanobacteriorum]|jgi:hypothetical protein|uniref:HipA N-terminal domain-containing protein n=1 Tax=Hymenobacter cyanobacteriorum TaxID=2926463 RepID=UPI003BB17EE5
MVDLALVRLWGQLVGAVRWDSGRALATFAYDPAFAKSGLRVSPLMMESIKKCGAVGGSCNRSCSAGLGSRA